ncbi:MAG: hypothetical protein FH761_10135 [Firmicutes bacterium]|nr:hypothetical protein [Bacillota bacterium]
MPSFEKYNLKWVILITLWTFLLAICVSLISESLMRNLEYIAAFLVLIFIISFGVFFDTIGIAVAASNEKPFHSMASNKVAEAKYAIRLIRNAGPVSNFCNDVIGDISGIISGAAGTMIVYKLIDEFGFIDGAIISIVMSAFVASLTVGGKALGKEIAMDKCDSIIFYVAKVVMVLDIKLGIKILPDIRKKRNKKNQRKREGKSGRNSK